MAEYWRVKAVALGVNYFVEGVDEDEAGDFQSDSILYRMDGPILFQGSAATDDEWYRVEMQLLCTKLVTLTNDNAYEIYEWAGTIQAAMANESLPIYRYGSGVEDDDSLIGCLQPDPNAKSNIRVASYGMLDANWRVKQVSVNGKFILCPE
jgi:hypothetical protein